jgi:hypothetical protein
MSGNCVTGNVNKASNPSSTMINEITSDNTGRFIKVSNIKNVIKDEKTSLHACARNRDKLYRLKRYSHTLTEWLQAMPQSTTNLYRCDFTRP